jgi:hypothetical protein
MSPKVSLWMHRAGGFFLTVIVLCVMGAALGAALFPWAGKLGGSRKTLLDLAVLGARTGGFFFLVWAPGAALVREFIRAEKKRRKAAETA